MSGIFFVDSPRELATEIKNTIADYFIERERQIDCNLAVGAMIWMIAALVADAKQEEQAALIRAVADGIRSLVDGPAH